MNHRGGSDRVGLSKYKEGGRVVRSSCRRRWRQRCCHQTVPFGHGVTVALSRMLSVLGGVGGLHEGAWRFSGGGSVAGRGRRGCTAGGLDREQGMGGITFMIPRRHHARIA